MQKVKVLALFAVVAAVVAAILRKRELASASAWQGLGASSTPATATSTTAVAPEPATSLPEGYDPLTDPIPPNEL